jgi:hypothetical protein
MPSSKSPSVVNPGPGKLAAGQVPASALSFPAGSGGDVDAHITDPIDAHMASAIGVNPIDPSTGRPVLTTAGGPYDGESVLDVLVNLSDLLPIRPDRIGFDNPVSPNSGITNWSSSLTVGGSALHGGFTKLGAGVVTKYLTPTGSVGVQTIQGIAYPADRGVLAVYKSTTGNYFDAANVTLVGALWLGSNPPPAGIAGASFNETTRTTGQTAYTASNVGADIIGLTARLPYLNSYPGLEYTAYSTNFYSYQLCKYSFPVTLSSGDAGSFLLVHWKETYAITLASIQPVNLTGGNLVTSKCYSAVPSDTSNYDYVNRLNIFADPDSGVAPSGGAITTSPAGTVTTSDLSGIHYYNSTSFAVTLSSTINNLFDQTYFTNVTASGSVPVGFESTVGPAQVDMSHFGGAITNYPLYNGTSSGIVDNVSGNPYTTAAPPTTSSVARMQYTAHPTGVSVVKPNYPYSQVRVRWQATFSGPVYASSSELYLWDNAFTDPTLTSDIAESFCSEDYRYVASYGATLSTAPILPAGGDDFDSTVSIPLGELQVQSGRVVYPMVDFTAAGYRPTQAGRDYAAIHTADLSNNKRRLVRAFDTGIARNTGKIRLTGLPLAAFTAGGTVDSAEVSDHTGGAIIQLKVPGSTGWLDLGRLNGTPDSNKALDFRGCQVGVVVVNAGPPILEISYDTGSSTANNGSGKFLLFVRITIIKNGLEGSVSLQKIEWVAP